jgi:hypothetical protein
VVPSPSPDQVAREEARIHVVLKCERTQQMYLDD